MKKSSPAIDKAVDNILKSDDGINPCEECDCEFNDFVKESIAIALEKGYNLGLKQHWSEKFLEKIRQEGIKHGRQMERADTLKEVEELFSHIKYGKWLITIDEEGWQALKKRTTAVKG